MLEFDPSLSVNDGWGFGSLDQEEEDSELSSLDELEDELEDRLCSDSDRFACFDLFVILEISLLLLRNWFFFWLDRDRQYLLGLYIILVAFLPFCYSLLEVTVCFDFSIIISSSSLSSFSSSGIISFFGTLSAETIRFLDSCLLYPKDGFLFVACLKNVVLEEHEDFEHLLRLPEALILR